ncbi:hypothetical protein [Paenibacillus solani]|uniref:Uncharacterized protein n=1 Tax=Paenibacillus solani TaxID=1705565 RepID=A0A0M1P0F7_9BACL|nr:hypothetical protein [Paenibacillus solani]KOR87594.1 hypothetical protein AM231_16955 [Paenibacillus solani]
MRRKKLVLSLTVLFVAAYVLFGVWIAHDIKVILEKAMSGATDHADYMNQMTYQKINPIERGVNIEENFTYNKKSHRIGFVLPLHFFFVSKVFVTQQYENDSFGFKEPINLTLKLKFRGWYATQAHIEP